MPLHVVTGGALTVTITSEQGRRSIVAVLSAGDLFGGNSYGAATHPPQPEVKALLRSHLLVLAWTEVEELVHEDWVVARWLIRRLLENQHHAQHHTAQLLALGVPGRLEAVLRELAERHGRVAPGGIRVALPLTQDMLAGLVGASRETVNRALGALAVEGRVLRSGRSYLLPAE